MDLSCSGFSYPPTSLSSATSRPLAQNSQEGTGCISEESNEFSLRMHLCRHHLYKTPQVFILPLRISQTPIDRVIPPQGDGSVSTDMEVYKLWPTITRTAGRMCWILSAVGKHGWGHSDFCLLLYNREMISPHLMQDFFNGFIYLLISSKDNFAFLKEIQSNQPLKPSTLDIVENLSLFISNKKYACVICNKKDTKGSIQFNFPEIRFCKCIFKKNKNKNMSLSTSFVASSHQKMNKHLQYTNSEGSLFRLRRD